MTAPLFGAARPAGRQPVKLTSLTGPVRISLLAALPVSFIGSFVMRMLLLSLALCLVAAPFARADIAHPSQTLCDSKKIGARELADCLRAAADRSEKELAGVLDAAAKSVDTRVGLLSNQKARWKRSLNESQAQWLGWRDTDCQDVAPFESGMTAKGGDPRLACIIDHNAQRIEEMKSRYP
jgi:uncharacterized protein YecT (DUF1311 family)